LRQARYRNEVLLDIVAKLFIDGWRYDVMRASHEKSIAIRRGTRSHACPQGAARATFVVNDHAFTQLLAQLMREWPGKGIGTAAGRKWHDDSNGTVRPCRLHVRANGHRRQCKCGRGR